jgi:hypothetical protein
MRQILVCRFLEYLVNFTREVLRREFTKCIAKEVWIIGNADVWNFTFETFFILSRKDHIFLQAFFPIDAFVSVSFFSEHIVKLLLKILLRILSKIEFDDVLAPRYLEEASQTWQIISDKTTKYMWLLICPSFDLSKLAASLGSLIRLVRVRFIEQYRDTAIP